jgi:hypothetical protein
MQRPETPAWVAGGVGHVRERTIELGVNIIAVDNIATMHVVASQRNWGPAIAGSLLMLFGFFLLLWPKTMLPYTFILVIAGIGCIVWVFARPPLHYLAIGTSDGRRTHIVSKNLEFLISVRDLFREKIDSQNANLQGQINIGLARFEPRGAAAPGAQPKP